jgi:hypothetical protein
MSELRRILDGPSTTPFERDLLESWASEQPSPAARARALAIAGAAAGTLAAAAAATATAASTGAAAGTAAPGTAAAGAGGAAVIAKWGILLALVVGSAVGGVLVLRGLRSARTADAPPTAVATSPLATTTTTTTPTATPRDEAKVVSPADLPAAAPAAATTTTAAGTAAATGTVATADTAAAASFAEEIASFDRARAALDAGDADRAIALVETYERRFPSGTFLQEAEVLRVQALTRKGDTAGAHRVGQRFLAAHPTSPHAARIRAILEASAR